MTSPATSTSASWKNPPTAIQVKYNLTSLPEEFEPTAQEKELLEMYETFKQYEKEAARLKEEAARAKLEAAAAKYEEAHQTIDKKVKKRKRHIENRPSEDLINQQDDDEDDYGSDPAEIDEEELQQPVSLAERRAAKLAQWQEELDETTREEREEEEMSERLLGDKQQDDDMDEVLIKRKRPDFDSDENKASLIANIITQETPPHEFSKTLDIKSGEGMILFPNENHTGHLWSPPSSAVNPNDEALAFTLGGFDLSKANLAQANNTVAIKFMVPSESKRFSVNIAGPNHRDYQSVLFHFNPRQFERGGQLVLNSKQEEMWGQAVNVPLSRIPKMFGETSSTLMIQIHNDGFDVFIGDKHCARFEHREDISNEQKLYLQFPATDDRGQVELWSVYKVWWGRKKILARNDLSDVYGVNAFVGMHPTKLFIKGLSSIHTQAEIDLRRAQLERAFRKYGGDRGVTVTIPPNATFAFVECNSEQSANRALEEMSEEYDIKRAWRKRYEALQEERSAAANSPGHETTEWD